MLLAEPPIRVVQVRLIRSLVVFPAQFAERPTAFRADHALPLRTQGIFDQEAETDRAPIDDPHGQRRFRSDLTAPMIQPSLAGHHARALPVRPCPRPPRIPALPRLPPLENGRRNLGSASSKLCRYLARTGRGHRTKPQRN